MSERPKETVLKTVDAATYPWVQIPPSPQKLEPGFIPGSNFYVGSAVGIWEEVAVGDRRFPPSPQKQKPGFIPGFCFLYVKRCWDLGGGRRR